MTDIVLRHCRLCFCNGVKSIIDKCQWWSALFFGPQNGVARIVMIGATVEERSDIKAECADGDAGFDEWWDVAKDGIPVETERQKKE